MEQLNLYLDHLKHTISGVDGELYFAVGADGFPSENWREPNSVKLNRDGSGAVWMKFFRDSREVYPETMIDFRELTRSVLKCLRTYDRTMHQWGQPHRWPKELSVLNNY